MRRFAWFRLFVICLAVGIVPMLYSAQTNENTGTLVATVHTRVLDWDKLVTALEGSEIKTNEQFSRALQKAGARSEVWSETYLVIAVQGKFLKRIPVRSEKPFQEKLPAGEYDLVVTKRSAPTWVKGVSRDAMSEIRRVRVVAGKTVSCAFLLQNSLLAVRGRVLDSDTGNGIANQTIMFRTLDFTKSEKGAQKPFRIKTNQQGEYFIAGIPPINPFDLAQCFSNGLVGKGIGQIETGDGKEKIIFLPATADEAALSKRLFNILAKREKGKVAEKIAQPRELPILPSTNNVIFLPDIRVTPSSKGVHRTTVPSTPSQGEPKATTKPGHRAAPATKPKQSPKSESKPATKPVTKSEAQPVTKSDPKTGAKAASKPTAKAVTKPEAKSAAKPEAKPVTKPTVKSATIPEAKPAAKPAARPETKPVVKPASPAG